MSDSEAFERVIRSGGVAVFPSDTVYGLACGAGDADAVERLYALKGRPARKPSAVMFFDLGAALAALPELGPRTRSTIERLLPGAVTVLLPNPAGRYPLAGGEGLGVRVVSVPALRDVRVPVLQSSANLAGAPDPRRVDEVPEAIRSGADVVIDGGELPGTPSTVVDLRRFEDGGIDAVSVLREGAVGAEELAAALAGQFHFNPSTYEEIIRADVPAYDSLQDALVQASGDGVRTILELGIGTGVTARRLLARHPQATLTGIDESAAMIDAAREALGDARVELVTARLQDPLPPGPFDLVASALCVHHLDGSEKAELFARVHAVLAPGGRFVIGDVVVPDDPSEATSPLTPGFDKPSLVGDQLEWLDQAGFEPRVSWIRGDLAVFVAIVAGP